MKTAFFPGKFQPLHIGHIETICRILGDMEYRDIDKLVIGVTEGPPRVMDRRDVYNRLYLIFEPFTLFDTIQIVEIDGVLTDYTDRDELPDFDIVYTGNDEVIEWAQNMGYEAKFFKRSNGIGYSGEELRKLYGMESGKD